MGCTASPYSAWHPAQACIRAYWVSARFAILLADQMRSPGPGIGGGNRRTYAFPFPPSGRLGNLRLERCAGKPNETARHRALAAAHRPRQVQTSDPSGPTLSRPQVNTKATPTQRIGLGYRQRGEVERGRSTSPLHHDLLAQPGLATSEHHSSTRSGLPCLTDPISALPATLPWRSSSPYWAICPAGRWPSSA